MKLFKPSKNPIVIEETLNHKSRSISLYFSAVKKDGKRFCAWCVEIEIHGANRKYCGDDCMKSAWAWAYPQKEDSLALLLRSQNFKCKECDFDYTDYMNKICERERKRYPNTPKINWGDCESWQWKRLKAICELKHRPEIDHIRPIFKNGSPLDRENLQVLCNYCHKIKTANDRRRIENG